MKNPFDEIFNGLRSQEHPAYERADTCQNPAHERDETWRDRMSAVADGLESGDEAMLIICRNGRTRIVKSDNGRASSILRRAVNACEKLNLR